MKQRMQGMTAGFIMAVLIFSTVGVLAATSVKSIEVTFNNYKTYLNEQEFITKDTLGNELEPFAYNGTIYVPLDAILHALGENARWDKDTGGLYFGKKAVESNAVYMNDVVTSYQNTARVNLNDKRENNANSRYHTYSSSANNGTGNGYFSMGSKKYVDGVYFRSYNPNFMISTSLYNLEGKYKTIWAEAGHVDDSPTGKATIYFYGDGKILQEIELSSGLLPIQISIDVTGVRLLKIEVVRTSGNSSYGLGNMIIQ
jgi:hypothetical protein